MPATGEGLRAWLRDAAGGQLKRDYALSALAWCRRLPELADVLPGKAWWKLWDHLFHAAVEAGAAPLSDDCSGDDVVVRQLLAGELALTLACLFPEIKVCRKLLPAARRVLSEGLEDLLDGEGVLHAKHFYRLPSLLACWTRCRGLGADLKRGCWNQQAERQYHQLARNALRLMRHEGTLVFSDPSRDCDVVALLKTAVALGGKPKDRALADRVLDDAKHDRRACSSGLPRTTAHSEWAAAAVLQPDWSRSAPRLTVLYPNTSCRVELACGRDVLWSGEWALDLKVNGAKVAPTSEWSELCWVSDDDVDYLELEIELGDGLRVQRHILLAREDRFLLLADAILASRRLALEYRGTLPLCPGVAFRKVREASRGTLAGNKPRATVLPLALPECSVQNALVANSAGLHLHQAAEAQSLFAPLFFDLDQRRMEKPLTWRQLTVAESWAIQPADVAVGYRVAIGRRQWLIYRALARLGNRSLLGHNISSEMLVARFDRKGEVEPLIEIE